MKKFKFLTAQALALSLTVMHLVSLETPVLAQNVAKGKPATMTSEDSGGSSASICFDGDYYANGLDWTCYTASEVHPSVTVDLEAVFHVQMIAVINRGDNNYGRIKTSELRVGNSTDPLENPPCDVVVNDGGFYDCDLWGQYVTLRRVHTKDRPFHVGEISVWAQKNICPKGIASLETVSSSATNAQDPVPIKAKRSRSKFSQT